MERVDSGSDPVFRPTVRSMKGTDTKVPTLFYICKTGDYKYIIWIHYTVSCTRKINFLKYIQIFIGIYFWKIFSKFQILKS